MGLRDSSCSGVSLPNLRQPLSATFLAHGIIYMDSVTKVGCVYARLDFECEGILIQLSAYMVELFRGHKYHY